MTTTSRNRHKESGEPHWLEWVTGIVSAILILAMIAWITGVSILREEVPPRFRSTVTAVQPVHGGYHVGFEIVNEGTITAAAVVVRGEIVEGGQVVEAGEVTFDYIPATSKSSGGMLFLQDPAGRDEVRVRAVGYTDP